MLFVEETHMKYFLKVVFWSLKSPSKVLKFLSTRQSTDSVLLSEGIFQMEWYLFS